MEGFKVINYGIIKKDSYLINNKGDIYSLLRHRYLTSKLDKDGYKAITLQDIYGKRNTQSIAKLVMITFIGIPSKDIQDSDILNNHYTNLEWMERGLNSSIRHIKPKGELNGSSILTEKEVLEICDLLVENKLTLKDIGRIYGVDKATVFNIKRKKTWVYITQNYNFQIRYQKNKSVVL